MVQQPPLLDRDGKRAVRAPGAHLSTIIRYIAKSAGMLKTDTYRFVGKDVKVSDEIESLIEDKHLLKLIPQGRVPMRMAIGIAWEAFAAQGMPDMIWQPGEVEKDGVSMNPDGVSPAPKGGLVVEEFKCTYKSSLVKGAVRDVAGEWMWMAQCKGYCLRYETCRARLHVLYVNGGYRFDGEVPEYWTYDIQFTEQELTVNWSLMLRNKSAAMKGAREEEKMMKKLVREMGAGA
jgi:hypothetical protein